MQLSHSRCHTLVLHQSTPRPRSHRQNVSQLFDPSHLSHFYHALNILLFYMWSFFFFCSAFGLASIHLPWTWRRSPPRCHPATSISDSHIISSPISNWHVYFCVNVLRCKIFHFLSVFARMEVWLCVWCNSGCWWSFMCVRILSANKRKHAINSLCLTIKADNLPTHFKQWGEEFVVRRNFPN